MSKTVSIVGRPNVGKSTLFNRLLKKKEAIVAKISGVTRDRNYGESEWNGVKFSLIDTGGYIDKSLDLFSQEIKKQVELAIYESEIILFLVDGKEGLTNNDRDIANLLRKSKNFIFLVINKIDNAKMILNSAEFYELGYQKLYCISSISGSGTGDLLDDLVVKLLKYKDINIYKSLPKVTIAGRPNVGKSTLYNILLNQNRSIVTNIAGTTRDSIKTIYKKFGYKFILTDTAGIRKKNKIYEDLEFYSIIRSIKAIENSDIVIIMIDAKIGWESQDMNIFNLAQKNKKGILILVNKWDLLEKDDKTLIFFEQKIRQSITPFVDVPIIFISAIKKQRILKTVDTVIEIYKNQKRKIKTSILNEVIKKIIDTTPPPSIKGKYIKIKYCTQLFTNFPQFVFFCNFPEYIKSSYKRYIENQIRNNFNFHGVSIQLFFRKK